MEKSRNERPAGKVRAEAFLSVFRTVGNAVICSGTGQLCIQLTGSVPGTAGRSDGRGVADKTAAAQILHQVAAAHAPVRPFFVFFIIAAPAGQSVYKDIRQIHSEIPVILILFAYRTNRTTGSHSIPYFHFMNA